MKLVFEAYLGDETLLGTLTEATDKRISRHYNGSGTGSFSINRHSSQVAWCEPGNFVKAYIDSTSNTPAIFAFYLESGRDILTSRNEQGGQDFQRGGRGLLIYLERAIIDNSSTFGRYEGTSWTWTDGTHGQIVKELIDDAQVRSALPLLTYSFDETNDTDSNAWDTITGDYELPVGLDLLQALQRQQSAGLVARMSPDFVLSLHSAIGTDLSGTITFEAGVNISEEVTRDVLASAAKSRMLVQGMTTDGEPFFRWVTDAGTETALGDRREGFVSYQATAHTGTIDKVGLQAIQRLKRRHDGLSALGVLTDVFVPFTDYFPGDTVTVIVTGVWEPLAVPITGIALFDTASGEADCILEFEDIVFEPLQLKDRTAADPGLGGDGGGGSGNNGGGGPGARKCDCCCGPSENGIDPVCGITDTFNRANDPDELGLADCGRTWTSFSAYISGNLGWGKGGKLIGPNPSGGRLPGPWPVPFDGTISLGGADVHAGFEGLESQPTDDWPLLGSWGGSGNRHFGHNLISDDDELILVAGPATGPSANAGAPGGLFDVHEPIVITGHIRHVVTDGSSSILTLDEFIGLSFTLGPGVVGFTIEPEGGPGQAKLVIQDADPAEEDLFPANWWRDNEDADFSIEYTGGMGGDVTVTVGPLSIGPVPIGAADFPGGTFNISNFSDDNDTELGVSNLLFNDRQITGFSWHWEVAGIDEDDEEILYNFGYVGFGGEIPTGVGGVSAEIVLPQGTLGPTLAPPFVYAQVRRPGGGFDFAFQPTLDDAVWIFSPIVVIEAGQASVQAAGAATVTVVNANAVDGVGDPAPLPDVAVLDGVFRHIVVNGQGEYVNFDNLNVVGVNNCHSEEFVAAGGTPETFTLAGTPTGVRRVFLNGSRLSPSAVGGTGVTVEIDTTVGNDVLVEYET